MNKIRRLHPSIVAKIAAGEVIERPAYAVKELLENAIDAKATSVRIDLEKSGLEKITVTDNGEGMSREDLLESFKPHTTSKIFNEDDLVGIRSLGFRGEALSSIAAISSLSIKSRSKNSAIGTEVFLEGNKFVKFVPAGMAKGTVVTVEDLFHSVPARKKFLKSLATEFRYILQIITQYAVAFPAVHFHVTHNKKTILNVPADQDVLERVREVFGEELYQNIVPFSHEDAHSSVSGFISSPQFAQSSTQKQFIFINGRTVKSKTISSTLKDAYGTLISAQYFPAFILFLKTPFDLVDVNVHPRKEEVSFHNEGVMKEMIKGAVEKSLDSHNLTFQDKRWRKTVYTPQIQKNSSVRDGSSNSYAAKLLKEEKLPWQLKKTAAKVKVSVIGQLHNLYILTQANKGFIIFDQHAVHERVLYEQFEKIFAEKKEKGVSIKLKKPVQMRLSINDKELLTEYKNEIEKMGFKINEKEEVTHVPELFKDRDIAEFITGMLADFEEERVTTTDSRSKRMLAYLACRSAVKAGDSLTKEECISLIKQLENVKNSYTCPHGRPLKIEMDLESLHILFRRK